MRIIVFLTCLLVAPPFLLQAQEPSIIPKPVTVIIGKGQFTITESTLIKTTGKGLTHSVDFLNDYLLHFYGFTLAMTKKSPKSNVIFLNFERMDYPIRGAYRMDVNNKNIYIAGDNEEGVFYAVQSLIQLLPVKASRSLAIQAMKIEDRPRFAWRGLHLDVGRHFFPVDFIKKYIDFIALHKMNYFHWHLTEDQGWRIEIKKYPKLTEIGSCRNGTIIGLYPGKGNDSTRYCGYYTQDEIKEVVKYAGDRYITIIPEIELPGHSSAAIAAYPQLSCFPDEPTEVPKGVVWAGPATGKQIQQAWGIFKDVDCPSDYTFKFLEDVLNEVIQLFPSKYIHIGGDECPKESWKRSAFCQNLIKENGLKDEEALQSYFIQRIEKYVNSKGRQIIGWDEILEGGISPNATVMSWRGEKGGIDAAKQHHSVIMTPDEYLYFDYKLAQHEDSLMFEGFLPLDKVYNYEPIPKELSGDESKYIIGAQASVWTEYISNPAKVEYMIFPRLTALSEVLWSPKENKDWDDFLKRLKKQFRRYDLWKVNYCRGAYDDTQKN
jgi:hexosaminidase